jgi:hypothetical protein
LNEGQREDLLPTIGHHRHQKTNHDAAAEKRVLKLNKSEEKGGWQRFAKGVLICSAALWVLAIPSLAMGDPKTTPPGHHRRSEGHRKHPGMVVPGHGNDYSPPAKGHQMPELDAGSFSAALALLVGGTMILRGRRHRRP